MLHCTQCGRVVEVVDHRASTVRCVGCGALLEVELFPAFKSGANPGSRAEGLADESDAACFSHPDKKAVAACSQCGRFLCSLCEVEMGSQVVCFDCFSEEARAGGGGRLETRVVLYDSIALALAIVPVFLFWPSLIAAPIVLFMCFRYWNRQGGFLPRSRWRFVVAALLAALQIVGWAALAVSIAGMPWGEI